MGLEWSAFNIIGSAMAEETTTETKQNGDKIVTKRQNPYISGLAISGASLLLLAYMDGGNGMVSKSFGKVCLDCAKKT